MKCLFCARQKALKKKKKDNLDDKLVFHCSGLFQFNFFIKLENQKAKFKSYQLSHTLHTIYHLTWNLLRLNTIITNVSTDEEMSLREVK